MTAQLHAVLGGEGSDPLGRRIIRPATHRLHPFPLQLKLGDQQVAFAGQRGRQVGVVQVIGRNGCAIKQAMAGGPLGQGWRRGINHGLDGRGARTAGKAGQRPQQEVSAGKLHWLSIGRLRGGEKKRPGCRTMACASGPR